MEDSLFNRPVQQPPPQAHNETLLHALIMQGVGRRIKEDLSPGKKAILKNLVPKTRTLKKLLNTLEDTTDDQIILRGIDDAVDYLDVIYNVINSKFAVEGYIPMNVD